MTSRPKPIYRKRERDLRKAEHAERAAAATGGGLFGLNTGIRSARRLAAPISSARKLPIPAQKSGRAARIALSATAGTLAGAGLFERGAVAAQKQRRKAIKAGERPSALKIGRSAASSLAKRVKKNVNMVLDYPAAYRKIHSNL